MTIELALCIVLLVAALPVSKSIAAHYAVFVFVNLAFLGISEADSSILVVIFAILAITDASLVIAGGRPVLLISAAASSALALESSINQDWLLSHVSYISIIVNTLIVACMAKECRAWMRGKFGH